MTGLQIARRTRTENWGWGLLLVLAALLAGNAVWLYATAGSESLFEQDTGARLADVTAAYPTVTSALESITRTSAALMLGLGLAAAFAALQGLRLPAAPVSAVPLVAALTLAGIGVLFFVDQRPGLALYHVLFGALFVVGQLLVVSGGRTIFGRRTAPVLSGD